MRMLLVFVGLVACYILLLGLLLAYFRSASRGRRWNHHEESALAVANTRSPRRPRPCFVELMPLHGKWRWLLWDGGDRAANLKSGLIDGMLVPYDMGTETTRNQARLAAHDAVQNLDFPATITDFREVSP